MQPDTNDRSKNFEIDQVGLEVSYNIRYDTA
jgi:hypothetical protein